ADPSVEGRLTFFGGYELLAEKYAPDADPRPFRVLSNPRTAKFDPPFVAEPASSVKAPICWKSWAGMAGLSG
ncbi:MAG TPA: hypothetical protein VE326_00890, partial [Candidatus Binatia bacterium]|nr:hypothetical protein [Candidatus Binatia bacterium]